MVTESPSGNARNARLHFGFFVVFALVICMFCPVSFGHSCAGIFYPYAAADLGVGTGVLSYFTPLACLSGLVFLPFAGRLLNGCDARACIGGSCFVAALAFFLVSFSTQLWQYLACGVLMGFGTCTLIYLAPRRLSRVGSIRMRASILVWLRLLRVLAAWCGQPLVAPSFKRSGGRRPIACSPPLRSHACRL